MKNLIALLLFCQFSYAKSPKINESAPFTQEDISSVGPYLCVRHACHNLKQLKKEICWEEEQISHADYVVQSEQEIGKTNGGIVNATRIYEATKDVPNYKRWMEKQREFYKKKTGEELNPEEYCYMAK